MSLVSVIIPFYNSQRTLRRCLLSVQAALREDMEVILVSDGSTDDSVAIAAEFPFKLISSSTRSGPATARNKGAEEAKGEYLLFVDADVLLREDTIEKLLETYNERSDIVGVSAIYSDRPVADGLFQEFKTIEETYKYSSYTSDEYSAFDTHCGSVRSDIFIEIGGFNTAYSGADTEDVEFGHQISRKYKNCINPDIVVDHIYANYTRGLRNYCWRSFYWIRLFLSRLKFEQAVTTGSNAFSVLLAFSLPLFILLSFFRAEFLWLGAVVLAVFVLWNIRFFKIVIGKTHLSATYKVPIFLFYLYTLQLAVGVGAAAGVIYWSVKKLFQKKNIHITKQCSNL